MKVSILTLFPGMFPPLLNESILGRAQARELLDVQIVDIRPFSENKHHCADDYPFGGGAGMVMMAQPIVDAMESVTGADFRGRRIYMSPRGAPFTQRKARELAQAEELVLLCGHYEGVDQRALDVCIDEELSIGDYVLTGGELAAMVVVDAVSRLIPGVLGSELSAGEESHTAGLLEYPHYTRPAEFRGLRVPDVLLSGNHANIARWRMLQSFVITRKNRPDLWEKVVLTDKERKTLAAFDDELHS